MRAILLVAILLFTPCLAQTNSVTISCGSFCNSTLKVTRDDPNYYSPPISLLRTLEWTVNGRRILVYPGASSSFNIDHFHTGGPGSHIDSTQIHARGFLLGSANSVIGGLVYSLNGDFPGGNSRISEKLDVVNKTAAPVSLLVIGMGAKPTQPNLEMPDLSGLEFAERTAVFIVNGSSVEPSPAYGQVKVFQIIPFSGFNPVNSTYTIPAGGTLTTTTELIVGNPHWPAPVH